MKAVVLGGTGAVGTELVGQLLASSTWSHVTTVGRKEVHLPEHYKEHDPSKLEQKVVDMDKLITEGLAGFQHADTVFCALGTTRKAAGSAEQFKKVDLHYVQLAAQAAKQANVHHFSLCSAKGANANVWASDWTPFHGLLYAKTKGQAEDAVKSQGIPAVSIFQPGVLDRGGKARSNEKIALYLPFLTKTHVRQVAKAMIQDAESTAKAGRTGAIVIGEASMQ